MQQLSVNNKTLALKVAKTLILFSAAIYVLGVPGLFIQGRILNGDLLLPYESVFCLALSFALFAWFTLSTKNLIKTLRPHK